MQIRSYETEGVLVVEVKGVLDANTVSEFQERLRAIGDEGEGPLIVDMSGLTEIYSVGLAALPSTARLLSERRRLLFCGVRPPFRELMRITLMDRQLALSNDLPEAIELMQGALRT